MRASATAGARVITAFVVAVFFLVGFRPMRVTSGNAVHTRTPRGARQVLASDANASQRDADRQPACILAEDRHAAAAEFTTTAPGAVRVRTDRVPITPIPHLKIPPSSQGSDASASA